MKKYYRKIGTDNCFVISHKDGGLMVLYDSINWWISCRIENMEKDNQYIECTRTEAMAAYTKTINFYKTKI